MTVFEYDENVDYDEDLELTTKDNKIINLKIEDLLFFSKFPDATLWTIYKYGGFKDFKNFIKNFITKQTFDAIIHYYNFEKWPEYINIPKVSNPYNFLNLPSPNFLDIFVNCPYY
jgi:hypothetical protein